MLNHVCLQASVSSPRDYRESLRPLRQMSEMSGVCLSVFYFIFYAGLYFFFVHATIQTLAFYFASARPLAMVISHRLMLTSTRRFHGWCMDNGPWVSRVALNEYHWYNWYYVQDQRCEVTRVARVARRSEAYVVTLLIIT